MVRFLLRNRAKSVSVKMDLGGEEEISEISDTASEYWGGGFILRRGYSLLRADGKVGDLISDGDVVEAIPDPDSGPGIGRQEGIGGKAGIERRCGRGSARGGIGGHIRRGNDGLREGRGIVPFGRILRRRERAFRLCRGDISFSLGRGRDLRGI